MHTVYIEDTYLHTVCVFICFPVLETAISIFNLELPEGETIQLGKPARATGTCQVPCKAPAKACMGAPLNGTLWFQSPPKPMLCP